MLEPFYEHGRAPDSVFKVFSSVYKCQNESFKTYIDQCIHLNTLYTKRVSRIGLAIDLASHPTIKDRLVAIKSSPFVETKWDNASALSLFDNGLITDTFNDVIKEFDKVSSKKHRKIIKRDIASQEIENGIRNLTPYYLEYYNQKGNFFLEEVYLSMEDDPIDNTLVENPFTESNASILYEYYLAEKDLQTLIMLEEEHSPTRAFSYNTDIYWGDSVPLDEHRSYYNSLEKAALKIAQQCNIWLNTKASVAGREYLLWLHRRANIIRINLLQNSTMFSLIKDVMDKGFTLDLDPQAKLSSIISYKECISLFFDKDPENDTCVFEEICDLLGVEKDTVTYVNDFYYSQNPSSDSFIRTISTFNSILDSFCDYSWEWVKRELILRPS
jgi:hypothetical protein